MRRAPLSRADAIRACARALARTAPHMGRTECVEYIFGGMVHWTTWEWPWVDAVINEAMRHPALAADVERLMGPLGGA